MSLLLAALLAAAPPAAKTPPPVTSDESILVKGMTGCGPPFARLYVAPMGEPFRGDGFHDQAALWFAGADKDHDGKLTLIEFAADADRFFTTLDVNHDGEIDPQELSVYENQTVPEIKLYQPGQHTKARTKAARKADRTEARARADYDTPYGAGLYSALNIPEPVISADLDLNRGVSREEFNKTSSNRFSLLDRGGQGMLLLPSLPHSPAQIAIDDCRAAEVKKKGP